MAAIDYDKLNTKLGAILAKDPAEIKAKYTHIPFLGNDYDVEGLIEWLQERAAVLDEIKKELNINKVNTFVDNNSDKCVVTVVDVV